MFDLKKALTVPIGVATQREGSGEQKSKKESTRCGARTHDHTIKSRALCR